MGTPEISVVILAYKSGDFAKVFYERTSEVLKAAHLNYEIVIVGNYWPNRGDITPDVVREIASKDPRVKPVIEEKTKKSQAMGYDVRAGMNAASGETIALIDGDGQMPPEDIPQLYQTLKKNDLDLCKATRITRGDGNLRRLISNIYNVFMQILFPGITNDVNGKPKLVKREAYEKLYLVSNDWFIDAEIMIKARRFGFKVGEIGTNFYKNPERESFISIKSNLEFLKNILVWRVKEFFIRK
jgi:glycosyltransferase involved in cell wall biosynthesis